MPRLSSADQWQLLTVLRELYAHADPAAIHDTLLRITTQVVPNDWASYNEANRADSRISVVIRHPDPPDIHRYLPALYIHSAEHPMAVARNQTGDGTAKKFSDSPGWGQHNRSALYHEFYRPVGARHQMLFFFDRDGATHLAIALNRRERDFSECERALLNVLRPHYAQAFENVSRLSRLRAGALAMERVQSARGDGTLVVDCDDRVHWISAVARKWLAGGVGRDLGEGAALPEELSRWLREQCLNQTAEQLLAGPPAALHIAGAGGSFTVRLVGRDGEGNSSILVAREGPPASWNSPRLPELSSRENEVIGWIAQGKSNPEIAAILGLSVRAVYKHAENIYCKLGVENRAGAMLRVLERR